MNEIDQQQSGSVRITRLGIKSEFWREGLIWPASHERLGSLRSTVRFVRSAAAKLQAGSTNYNTQ